MLRRVQKYIETQQLLRWGDRVLVCVSGGADSVALLDVLHQGGYACVAAHCNFHLRGEESERDEQFVRRLCEDRGLPLRTTDFDTTAYARSHALGIEMAARELRYRWFEQVAQEEGCTAIAVAHHQNDQAETLLLNLRRGTGIRGLAGMRPLSANPCCPEGRPIIRPLLCTTRDYIEHYLRDKRHIDWVEDSTNKDTTIARNAIRAELTRATKAEIENIARTAEYMQGYVDWLEQKDTRAAHHAQLYEQLRPYHFPEVEKIYDALQRGIGGKTFYAPHHVATIRRGRLQINERTLHFGLVGYPLEHSFSARYFTEKFEREHIAADYRLFPLPTEDFAADPNTLLRLLAPLDGANITHPYKEQVIPYLERLDETAAAVGAVNVVHHGTGYNTDCIGFMESIRPMLTTEDRQALVLGTGGAAKAVVYGLQRLGITPTLVSRSRKEGCLTYAELTAEVVARHTVIVNCTPLGMYPEADTCPPIPYEHIGQQHLLFDCVYNPEQTLFLQRGAQQGARTKNGLEMLHRQAEAAWAIWCNF